MNINIVDGEIVLPPISVWEMFTSMSDEDKVVLIETLSCQGSVIRHVFDQIFEGCTENGYCGSSCSMLAEPVTELGKAVRKAAKMASEHAAKEIERLEHALKCKTADCEEASSKYWALYHKRGTIYG
jgi:hypothetical protein